MNYDLRNSGVNSEVEAQSGASLIDRTVFQRAKLNANN